MIIACPGCKKKLRIDASKYAGKKLSLTCRNCLQNFPFVVHASSKILVAHGEADVCRDILDVCSHDLGEILTCSDADTARKYLDRHAVAALLLDVSLPGAFPFQLIEEAQRRAASVKIILLPSVYNRTAYKRKPSSLYGADAYLELHHLADRLIPLLHELVPELALKSTPFCAVSDKREERALAVDSDARQQAEELSRLLIADIALYHQEQIDQGIMQKDLPIRLASQLEEGRRMLACRIPQVELDRQDYILSALECFATARERELRSGEEGFHG